MFQVKSRLTAGARPESLPAPVRPMGSQVLTTQSQWMFSTDSATSKSFLGFFVNNAAVSVRLSNGIQLVAD